MYAPPQQYGFGGIPPYHYGILREQEKQMLRRQSVRAGLCVTAFILLQEMTVYLLAFVPPLYALCVQDGVFAQVFEILFLLLILSPFLLSFVRMAEGEKEQVDQFRRPVSKPAAVLAVVSGYFFCTVGNFVTSYLLVVLETLGFSVGGGEYAPPQSPVQFVLMLLTIGVLPAMLEEFSLRGVVMQPLRFFGDRFAIVMTAFVFAMMHGNLTQIPFAFIAGIAMGYFVVATGSLWVGIAIHLLNNLSSVVLTYLLQVRPTAGEMFYHIETSVSIVAGLLCTALFLTVCKHNRLQKKECALCTGEKVRAYLFTAPMIISILLLILETVRLIQFTGYGYAG